MEVTRKVAAVALTLVRGIGVRGALRVVALTDGKPERAFEDRGAVGARDARLGDLLARGAAGAVERARRELEWCGENGVEVVAWGEEGYPKRLRALKDAPVALYCMGKANLGGERMVSVVGTRKPSAYGEEVCAKIVGDLKAAGGGDVVVVSGLAYGIDVRAHRAALEEGLGTIAVLAHGADRIYPDMHRDTAREMVERGGALVTEYVRGTAPERGNFICRNRLIAGLGAGTIVVESGRHGGALVTAGRAKEMERPVWAVPGRWGETQAEGCIDLIERHGARIYNGAEGVAKALGWTGTKRRTMRQGDLFEETGDAKGQRVMDALRETDGATAEEIGIKTGMGLREAATVLLRLEMEGKVRLLPGNVYKCPPGGG